MFRNVRGWPDLHRSGRRVGRRKYAPFPVPTTLALPSESTSTADFSSMAISFGDFGPPILHDASQKTESATHAITLYEMRVRQQALQERDLEEPSNEGYAFEIRIGRTSLEARSLPSGVSPRAP